MQTPSKARTKQPAKTPAPYAIRVYLSNDAKERKQQLTTLKRAADLQKRKVSTYVLLTALAQAERELANGAR